MPAADGALRICVYGAGAVGGHFAVRLAAAGHRVSVVARGAHLAAIRADGLTLIRAGERLTARVAASDDPADLGPQDVVIVTLKAHALPEVAQRIAPLLGPDTPVIFAQNGVPWWYASGLDVARRAPPDLSLLNPALLADRIGMERVIGGVIYSSNDLAAPGVVQNNSPRRNRLIIGEIDDSTSPRIAMLRGMLEEAGIESPATDDLRARIWDKLIANMRVSLLAFLTERTSREVYDDPDLRPVIDRLGAEAVAIAAAHGVTCAIDDHGPSPGHKSSMLQDYERGRAQEVDGLVTAPQLFARAAGLDTPTLDTIAGLVRAKVATAPRTA
ncbi:2-dehydropantoate 2-reductase [Sphingomonas gilva]|uniref:2-dehydropantoate 2-reductase n=1 Tax=Sphingomonas gilva TaxID=2305907 RepID=A0A396RRW1_9SPHN|nr:2-dehydropantoate 2-reductase [Sphingomonas gilva]RHW19260.1 2-dehydropantoate 2-reductase [Sphingomonas gilva]